MKYRILCILVTVVIFTQQSFTQENINILDEVLVSDTKLNKFSEGYKLSKLSDSVIRQNDNSLTGLLRYNSTIYFRENGIGGTSSASFRGTGASQTAVIWNGININSQLNGQTDFNTISVNNYDNILIRGGGGSVQYGSGAIGGSIHLNNDFRFVNHFENTIRIAHGSFNTNEAHYKVKFGREKVYSDVGVDYLYSDNDYKYLGTPFRNENGDLRKLNINANTGVFINEKNLLKFYHNTFIGDRNFSGLLLGNSLSSSNDKFKDTNSRSLLEWKNFTKQYTSRLSVAHLHEMFRFFDNNEIEEYSFGKSNNLITKYDFLYKINEDIQVNAITDYSWIQGEGTNFINAESRNIFSGTLIFKHALSKKFNYTFNVRQEATNVYDSPLLFALDGKYNVSDNYKIKFNTSKNYRIPTYNDLYWLGPGGEGNPDLVPETSIQGEIGQEFSFKNFLLSVTGYYINTEDLIRWIPVSGSVWSPVNIDEVNSYGAEINAEYSTSWSKNALSFITNYGYTKSINKETDNQLIYVPLHKVTSSVSFTHKSLSAYYQFLYNGSVFITTDNASEIDGYDVSNVGLAYTHSSKHMNFIIDVKANNLFNKNYQNVGFRPMPNRNYQIQLTYKF